MDDVHQARMTWGVGEWAMTFGVDEEGTVSRRPVIFAGMKTGIQYHLKRVFFVVFIRATNFVCLFVFFLLSANLV